VTSTMMKGSCNAQHNIIQLQTELFCIQLPDSLPLNFIFRKIYTRMNAFHMSSAMLENMLIWTKNLENSYIRLRQNYTDLPKTAPNQCPKNGPAMKKFVCVTRKLLVTHARGLCGCAGEVNKPLNR